MKIIYLTLLTTILVISCKTNRRKDIDFNNSFESLYQVHHVDHWDTLSEEEYISNLDTSWNHVREIVKLKR
jgi:hypothetical protein